MSAQRKPGLYRQLRVTGRPLTRSYSDYTTEVLEAELQAAISEGFVDAIPEDPGATQQRPAAARKIEPELSPPAEFFGLPEPAPAPAPQPVAAQADVPQTPWGPEDQPAPAPRQQPATVPVSSQPDPEELPGQRLNTAAPDEVIRVDELGRKWHQEEVRKPAFPKPRGRRVLQYTETGVATQTVQNGEYVETFEVAGNQPQRPAQVKITLPSYQVGIYTDPRFPFKIHCYDGREGFDLQDVQAYFGGAELVPASVKRVYIENALCYDIRSVIRTIESEYRQLQLMGKIK
jgi:hypothetical protein